MATRLIHPDWIRARKEEIRTGMSIDLTSSFNKAIQTLIVLLTNANTSFKLYNLGAGVKRITADTDTCPCCKRKL